LGTVYSVTTSGKERVVFSFDGEVDGGNPAAALVEVNGTLYGTTKNGGSSYRGVVFSMTTSGQEQVLHSFTGFGDGANPVAALIAVNGALYGTSSAGSEFRRCERGPYCGTVYRITTDGHEKVLHVFTGYADGATPLGGLASMNGKLYGTTFRGGTGSRGHGRLGFGTVFTVTP